MSARRLLETLIAALLVLSCHTAERRSSDNQLPYPSTTPTDVQAQQQMPPAAAGAAQSAAAKTRSAARADEGAPDELASVPRISLEQMRNAYEKDTAIVIDVRDSGSFEEGHITGARHIPLSDIRIHVSQLPRDKMIITYCT